MTPNWGRVNIDVSPTDVVALCGSREEVKGMRLMRRLAVLVTPLVALVLAGGAYWKAG